MNATSTAPLIAHVINRLDFGGLENGLVNLVNHLPADRYRHTVVCLSGFNPVFKQRIRRADVQVLSIDKRPGKDVAAYARMWRLLRHLRPAIVHTRNFGTIDMQWVAAAAGVPHRLHGEHGWDASDPAGSSARRRMLRRACAPVIERYVPMSKDIARWLERDVGVPPERIRQLYSGVDCTRFHPPPERPGFEYDGRPLVIGTVGRLDPVKNQQVMIDAARTVIDRRPGLAHRFRLKIVGDGDLRPQLEAATTQAGLGDVVEFTGARDDIPEQMRSMDVFVLPSINEGISNTILEAMASGLPIVAARVGGNVELVIEGVTGRLYDAEDPQALATTLIGYLDQPARREQEGLAARGRALTEFSLDAMIRRYADLYDEVLSDSRAAGG